jgi:hypothetical protein
MKIKALEGEPGRYHVQSREDGDTYMVDLFANEGLGRCSCRDFECRRRPKQKEHNSIILGLDDPERTVCVHLIAARNELFNEDFKTKILINIAQQLGD